MQGVDPDSGQVRHIGNLWQAYKPSSWDALKGPGLEQAGARWSQGSVAGISIPFSPRLQTASVISGCSSDCAPGEGAVRKDLVEKPQGPSLGSVQ